MTIGLGCMRLSTEASRSDDTSEAVVGAALAAGVRLFDTADAYALDDTDVGHNERLLGRLLPADAVIVTKGGLTRPGGRWQPHGRAKHLSAAARASAERLGRAPDLYLLHAVDPQVPLATSVRALAKLLADGIVRRIGLSNVTRTQLLEALALAPISAVEVELSPWKLDALRGGLVALCAERGIQVLAHRPLGGPSGARRIAKDPVLRAIAARTHPATTHAATPAEVVLAWLASLGPGVVPIPGATRVESATSLGRAAALVLESAARAELAAHFLDVSVATGATSEPADRRATATRDATASGDPARDIVMLVGMPAAGKSTYSQRLVADGYVRFNRDERGGSLRELARAVDLELAAGTTKIVVDNTYASRATRAPVIAIAKKHGATIRGVLVATPIEQAQAHAAERILGKQLAVHGPSLLGAAPTTVLDAATALHAPGEILPSAQFRYRREYEPPALDEGFDALDEVLPPPLVTGTRPGVIIELDDVIWRGRPRRPQDIALRPGAGELVARHRGVPIGATAWQVGASTDDIAALAAHLAELLGAALPIAACVHPAGPPVCWCRKPMPGLALVLAKRLDLDLSKSVHVGQGPADKGFAVRAGMAFELG